MPRETSAQERLSQLRDAFALPPAFPEAMGTVLRLLEADPASLSAVREPRRAADAHVADALVALEIPQVRSARRAADLGAGAGFPGLALAAALPNSRFALVESVGRKCDFMRGAVEAAGLPNVDVVHARAEEWRDGIGRHDLVTARALAPLAVLCEYAAPLLSPGGGMVAWKGRRDASEEADALAAAAALGLDLAEVRAVRPYPEARHRHLHLYLKVSETPSRYPRRPGMARKRPLGGSRRA